MDHLAELDDDLARTSPTAGDWQPPAGFDAAAQALAAWLDATETPDATVDPAIYQALEAASKQLGAERVTGRQELLEAVALQRMPAALARAGLDTLAWTNGTLYHAWRLTRASSGAFVACTSTSWARCS